MLPAATTRWPRALVFWGWGLFVWLLVCSVPTLLLAHARLTRSLPMSNAVLTEPPAEVRCWFSEPIEVRFSTITVSYATREPVAGTLQPQHRVDQGWQEGPKVVRDAAVILPPTLAPGLYLVQWTIFAVDGHKASGTFSWTYQPAPAADDQTPRGTP